MPELPDIELYLAGLRRRIVGRTLTRALVIGPALLRTVDPPLDAFENRRVTDVRRLGKRIVIAFEGEFFLVIHLMIAGRLRWEDGAAIRRPARPGGRSRLEQARFAFDNGRLSITEAGTRKRATLHAVAGTAALAAHDPGGIEPLECSVEAFAQALRATNRTLKRSLTDPATVSGIGNAYSDEILHRARLSPIALTGRLDDESIARLHAAMVAVLREWTDRLQAQFGERFPGAGEVTAFRPEMAVHGRFGKLCPACGTAVKRIVRAENEVNYCPRCQTGGRVLADRSLSRLLKGDWPDRIEDWEGGVD
ncbi:MAG: hypothetical protein KDA22_00385 [Phycisphaerales bacterium]|nr:hypothetical protein [Phycisphaerales bacterium]